MNRIEASIKKQRIKSQIWGIDALLINMLFLRDHKHSITQKEYLEVL